MFPRSVYGLLMLVLILSLGVAEETSNAGKRIYTTERIDKAHAPLIDGKLDDDIWEEDNWAGEFIQREPHDNVLPTEQTAFKIVYDVEFLYIGIVCYDADPASINSRMSRRDGNEGDWIELSLDSYHDLRSAFSLTISAAGVQGDKTISLNGGNEDDTWNPVWYAESNINEDGWTSEMKIPLSQLRFSAGESAVWGLQVLRKLSRKEETSVWQRIPLDAPGWVSEFGELHGLENLNPGERLEIQPFVVNSLNTFEKVPQDPFRNANQRVANIGLDGKYSITTDMTLDFTLNPDFGQIEADPAAIALDGFQLFFDERRPFFVENKNIFNYKFSSPGIWGTFSSDNLFYSRRIGRAPQGTAGITAGEYADTPERTSILGAVKLSGKTRSGLSIGVMESVTAPEYAKINTAGTVRDVLVEPLTNYFVSRLQKDLNDKKTVVGGIITATHRNLEENVNFLHTSAVTGGLDFKHVWHNRAWHIGGTAVMSRIAGSREALIRTQRSIRHLYQREDASHLQLDSTLTSLKGHGGDLRIGKAGQGHLKFETGVTWRSPGLEINDVGFMREADDIQNYMKATYSLLQPFGILRTAAFEYKHWLAWDFGGNPNYVDWDVELKGTFKNNWSVVFGYYLQPHIYSKSLLRGGPRIRLADQEGIWWRLNSDKRKKLYFGLNGWTRQGGKDSHQFLESAISVTYQPLDQFSLSIAPRFITDDNRLQYAATNTYQNLQRYITGKLKRQTVSTSLRLNYTPRSNLSIQYYGEVFLSAGEYGDFSHVVDPLAETQAKQLHFYSPDQISTNSVDRSYLVDEDRDGLTDYTFANPDFSYAQYRSNLVARFEYRPGSEIFLVWAQGINNNTTSRSGLSNRFRDQILDKQPNNTFLIKATYRFLK